MLKISHQNEGYKVAISYPGTGTRGFSVFARNLPAVHLAIDHYYNMAHAREKHPDCPLCQKGAR